MNNDISSELTYIGTKEASHAASKKPSMPQTENGEVRPVETYETESYEAAQKAAQNYLNALGRTKVNMDRTVANRVEKYVSAFKNDPEFAQNHVDFCDYLQEHGYSLEDAVIGTDIILDILNDESIYSS